jgi:hypothetical protein
MDDPALDDRVELILGEDFASFLLVPRALHEVDALARAALPARDVNGAENSAGALDAGGAAPMISEVVGGRAGWSADALSVRSGIRMPTEVRITVDGRRPDGSSCS